jgi:hypothetical protein
MRNEVAYVKCFLRFPVEFLSSDFGNIINVCVSLCNNVGSDSHIVLKLYGHCSIRNHLFAFFA